METPHTWGKTTATTPPAYRYILCNAVVSNCTSFVLTEKLFFYILPRFLFFLSVFLRDARVFFFFASRISCGILKDKVLFLHLFFHHSSLYFQTPPGLV